MSENEGEIIKKHYSKIGKIGGQSTSKRKTEAVRQNARRPRPSRRIPDDQLTDAQRKRRERDAARAAKDQQDEK